METKNSKDIFFEAVLLSLPQVLPEAQVLCRDCNINGNEDEVPYESHECYYMTVPGYVSANFYQLLEKAGRKKITIELVNLLKKYNVSSLDIITEIYSEDDPYEKISTNKEFLKEFLTFVKNYKWMPFNDKNEEEVESESDSDESLATMNQKKLKRKTETLSDVPRKKFEQTLK